MSRYNIFASYYDRLTENVQYKARAEYVSGFFSASKDGETLLDLACGTGTLAAYFSKMGYSVTGIDLSEEMLQAAYEKEIENAVFIRGDMTDFTLPYKVDNCVCSLDSINHLTDIEEVKKCFKCAAEALNEGGVFVFDVNTPFKHKYVLADNTFVFDEDEFFLSWDNEYLGEYTTRILLDFFVFNGENYDRYSEEIIEKAYTIDELSDALVDFETIGIYDDMSYDEPNDESERIYFVCKRK